MRGMAIEQTQLSLEGIELEIRGESWGGEWLDRYRRGSRQGPKREAGRGVTTEWRNTGSLRVRSNGRSGTMATGRESRASR